MPNWNIYINYHSTTIFGMGELAYVCLGSSRYWVEPNLPALCPHKLGINGLAEPLGEFWLLTQAFLAKTYYIPIWDLFGEKQNLLGYLPMSTPSSPTNTHFFHFVYQLVMPINKLINLSLSLSPNKRQFHGDIVNIWLLNKFWTASL